jgi:hypothetical protein
MCRARKDLVLNITIEGRYVYFECQKLDEEDAKRILESGLSEDEINEIPFQDGGDWGVIECTWEVDGATDSFELDSPSEVIKTDTTEGWILIKEECGDVTYAPLQIKAPYNANLLKFSRYSEVFNGYSIDYATPMYGAQEFEEEWREVDVCSLTLISPDGTCHSVVSDE